MRTLVCFGDSNTWGYVPGSNGKRFPRELRWPVRLQAALGDEWEVIAEGLNGRTATIERPDSEGRNGLPYLLPCLHSHAPVDVVVIFLGTNDVNFVDDDRVARCIARLVRVVRASEAGPDGRSPDALVVCPPPFDGHELGPSFAAELDCEVLDLHGIASYRVAGDDVEHLDEAGHAAVAAAVAERIRG
ncbi:MAG TPA: GDSL-type esterase/lipase family protein [Gaiellaceae bacterium]|nr:GDSL-type esterase/lipase family protein [Gaiellaceae bacterium]